MLPTTHAELEKHTLTAAKAKMPAMIHGPPGIGKSDTVRKVASTLANGRAIVNHGSPKEDEFGLIDLRASMMEPSDVLGVPFNHDGLTRYCPPETLPRRGEGVLLLDEINLAAPTIQAALYQLILDRRVGSYELPDGWAVIAAGNREEDGAYVFQMAKPLQNRFSQHLELLPPDTESWLEWAGKNGVHESIMSFLLWKQEKLFSFKKDSKDYAYPTPRTWAMLSRLLKAAKPDGDVGYEEAGNYATGCVGESTGVMYKSFLKHRRELKLDPVWKNPKKINDYIGKHELLYAAASAIAELGAKKKDKFAPALAVTYFVEDKEIGVYISVLMKSLMGPKRFVDGVRNATWEKQKIGQDWCVKYKDIIVGYEDE